MRYIRTQLIATAAVSAAVFGVAPAAGAAGRAAADPGWTVAPSGPYSAQTVSGVSPYFTDTATGLESSCASATAGGETVSGSGVGPDGLLAMESASWSACETPGQGGATSYTADDLPWSFNATSYDAATGTTVGTLTGVSIHQTAGVCSADIGGPGGAGATLEAVFHNSDHTLTVSGGNAQLNNVSGLCLGIGNSGDPVSFDAVFQFSGPLTITSP